MTITKSGEVASFYTVNKAPIKHLRVYFNPQQAGSGDPSPENVREIIGRSSVKSNFRGKNIGDFRATQFYADTDFFGNKNWSYTFSVMQYHEKSVTYSAYIDSTKAEASSYTGSYVAMYLLDANNNRLQALAGNIINPGEAGISSVTITISTNVMKISPLIHIKKGSIANQPMVEMGSIVSKYEPLNKQSIDVDWTNDIGTIYGGYVDLITGELVQEWKTITFNGTENWSSQAPHEYAGHSYDIMFLSDSISDMVYGQGSHGHTNWIPNYSTVADKDINAILCGQFGWSDYRYYIFNATTNLDGVTDVASLKQYLSNHPLTICYKLATPITHQLTPTQLQTLIGQNNIWSNADRVEVEYDLAESNDELYRRRNIILRGYPHIETASGNIASFQTDLAAPIKDAKIYFNPIQLGSGESSPENVREIIGIDTLQYTSLSNPILIQATEDKVYEQENKLSVESKNNYFIMDTIPSSTLASPIIPTNHFILNKNTKYYFHFIVDKCEFTNDTNIYINFLDINKQQIGYIYVKNMIRGLTQSAYTPSKQFDVYYIQLALAAGNGNCAIKIILTEEQLQYGQSTWNLNPGIIYGGYVDLIKGELIQTYYTQEINNVSRSNGDYDAENSLFLGWNATYPYIREYSNGVIVTGSAVGTQPKNGLCNQLQIKAVDNWRGTNQINTLSGAYLPNNFGARMDINLFGVTSSDSLSIRNTAINNYLAEHPIKVTYMLQTPIVHQLTPTQLKTLKGANNIWSSANGPVEISYWTH